MRIDMNSLREMTVPGMNGGTGTMTASMHIGENGKIIRCAIHKGGSIGPHRRETSDDINYVLSGTGKAYTDGQEEARLAGVCHICPKGSVHSIVNTGDEDLILLTVVCERK